MTVSAKSNLKVVIYRFNRDKLKAKSYIILSVILVEQTRRMCFGKNCGSPRILDEHK
jgi:hypothetical protein